MRSITRSTSTRFINSSSAATVGEQWPKPCMRSFLDDLGILIRRHEIFVFYYISQHLKGHINGSPVSRMLVDGGAVVNLMSYSVFKKLGLNEA